jgi:gliding motility-associated-like protein
VLASFDVLGCPKPNYDTVLVTVLPDIVPFAGNDTLVVVGQPVQFNATGGSSYEWIPATGLDNPNIENPIGTYGPETDSITYTVRVYNDAGCYDSAFIKVTVFKTVPSVFVPTAFSPNGDGLNDELRPIAVGIQRINYFRIYNRWGQMVFSTTTNGKGWDGRISGTPQGSNVFVWMLSAVDYLGNVITDKGTVTLVR